MPDTTFGKLNRIDQASDRRVSLKLVIYLALCVFGLRCKQVSLKTEIMILEFLFAQVDTVSLC